jgi:hypothetical protein
MKHYDYKEETKDVRAKVSYTRKNITLILNLILLLQTERLNAINELQQMLSDQKNVATLILPNLDEVMQMIEKNIFRPLPSVKK